MPVYYNKKTGATSEMKDSEFKKLNKDNQKRWRVASPSELKIHEKRMADKKLLADKQKAREKANAKNNKEKAKRYASKAPKVQEAETVNEGSTDQAESAEPNS